MPITEEGVRGFRSAAQVPPSRDYISRLKFFCTEIVALKPNLVPQINHCELIRKATAAQKPIGEAPGLRLLV